MIIFYRVFFILFFCFYFAIAYANIYKFVDAKGQLHFSDFHDTEITNNSEEVNVNNNKFIDAKANLPDVIISDQSKSQDFNYESFGIDYPVNNETVFFDAKGIKIKFHLKPNLQKQDQLVFLFDGAVIAKQSSEKEDFILQNTERGEHKLLIKIYSKDDKEIASSNVVTFFMRQNIVS